MCVYNIDFFGEYHTRDLSVSDTHADRLYKQLLRLVISSGSPSSTELTHVDTIRRRLGITKRHEQLIMASMGLSPSLFTPTTLSTNLLQKPEDYSLAYPSYWRPHPYDPTVPYIWELNSSHPRYIEAAEEFRKTVPSTSARILAIHVVQSPAQYLAYQFSKLNLVQKKSHLPGFVPEAMLWHGTHSRFIHSIASVGFRREYTTTYVYGYGCYFAVHSSYSYSTSYAKLDSAYVQRMFWCRVAQGLRKRGSDRQMSPEYVSGDSKIRYDSYCDRDTDPTIIATANDYQAYPDLVITFVRSGYEKSYSSYLTNNPSYTIDGTYHSLQS